MNKLIKCQKVTKRIHMNGMTSFFVKKSVLFKIRICFVLVIAVISTNIPPLYAQQEDSQWVNVSPFLDDGNSFVKGFFLSAQEGWIYQGKDHDASKLYYTIDGAQTFTQIFQFEDSLTGFLGIQMFDSKTGYAKSMRFFSQIDTSYLLKTNDGGKSWENAYDTSFFSQFDNINLTFHFIDSLTGFTSQRLNKTPIIYKTTDGAVTWHETNLNGLEEAGLIIEGVSPAVKFFFYDSLHGWATCSHQGSEGVLLTTTDGGLNWHPIITESVNLFGIHFISHEKGGVVGRNSYLSQAFLTNDNFQTFSYEYHDWPLDMWQYPYAISYQNDSIIWISGEPGSFYRSIDNGKTFELYQPYQESNLERIFDIRFFNGNVGYAFGSPNKLMKFTDTLTSVLNLQLSSNSFSLFPNPARENVAISFGEEVSGTISLITMLGQELFNEEINYQKKYFINLSEIPVGIYMIVFSDNKNNKYVKKLNVN